MFDNSSVGAVWLLQFNQSTGKYQQLGDKIVGTGGITPRLGSSVEISDDGKTIAIGGKFTKTPRSNLTELTRMFAFRLA